jgi:hypothetical protein
MVMAKDTRKSTVTKRPTYGLWFEKFMRGCHKRIGEIIHPDHALSSAVLLEILNTIDADWVNYPADHLQLAAEASFYIIAFCCTLRGEEVPLVDLEGLLKHWELGLSPTLPLI